MAVLLGIAEVRARQRRMIDNSTFIDAMLVGIAQLGALIPGVSRSGSTLPQLLLSVLGGTRRRACLFFLDCPPLLWQG
jgi:undecaprenyl-diphosphatase